MTDEKINGVVADEDAAERRYADALQRKAHRIHNAARSQAPNTWTHQADTSVPVHGHLVGRVALREQEKDLGGRREFYIGSDHLNTEDFEVFSWAAPVATCFYKGTTATHEYGRNVIAVRTLTHAHGRIHDFQDELLADVERKDLFPSIQLTVPKAPSRPRLSSPSVVPSAADTPDDTDATAEPTAQVDNDGQLEATAAPPTVPAAALPPGPPLRAPELLVRQLAAPKSVSMSSVLATLQPDQYEAIIRDSRESQMLQGHPGTGKTVIAAHRAAYLLSDQSPEWARVSGKVLVVGPTAEYVEHISGTLGLLIGDSNRYSVMSMPDLVEDLAGLARSTEPTESLRFTDVDSELARLVDEAIKRAKSNISDDRPNAADVYAELKFLLEDPPNGVLEQDWAHHLRELPKTYAEIKRDRARRHRGLLAYIGVRTSRTINPGHVIIDEAQDVSPIEWEVLGRLGNRGGWTILGDLNQRRTDHTFSSWDKVAEVLAIEDEDGHAPVKVLDRGYRSTAQIIAFANQLLPRGERKLFSLQVGGEAPTVKPIANSENIINEAVSLAIELHARVGHGTVAMIGSDQQAVRARLAVLGWKTVSSGSSIWTDGTRQIRVLIPERARGLEFDAVVVVEPAEFPENYGRQGVLYTALTRANRFLTVVHKKPLPGGLKAPR